jgi:hypothetical protein
MEDVKLITESWSETKGALLEGLSSTKRAIVDTLLENQRNHILAETAAAGAIQSSDIAGYRKNLLPMIRRVIPGTIATEIVGVQPMKTPVAQVFSMRYKYAEAVTHDPSRSQFGGNDIAAGDEVFGNAKALRQFYSGTIGSAQVAGASGITNAAADEADIAAATAKGEGWGSTVDSTTRVATTTLYGNAVDGALRGGHGSHIEGSGGRKMTLEVVAQAVEAQSRKLQAGWTIEAAQDMKSQHGLDIENEMVKGVSSAIIQEIDAEIINDLVALAGTVRSFNFAATGGTTYAPAFAGDRFANLGIRIGEVANEIARKTRLGAGNFIVVSPMMVTVLQQAAKSVFAPAVEGSFKSPTNTHLAGTLNGTIKVYSYLWNQAQPGLTAPNGTDKILVGYKGGNGEMDAGYFYCPYVPLQSSGVHTNPVTFQPVVSLMTRYGKAVMTNTASSLGNSADYYGRINVSNLEFV